MCSGGCFRSAHSCTATCQNLHAGFCAWEICPDSSRTGSRHYRLHSRLEDRCDFMITGQRTGPQDVAYPARVQNLQSLDERHDALLQRVQCVLLRVMVSEVVPQTPESIPEQLDLLCLQTHRGQTRIDLTNRLSRSLTSRSVKLLLWCVEREH